MADALITIRVPKDLRARMKRAGINWSEELRQVIRLKLEAQQRREAARALAEVLESVEPGFDSLRAIKEARRNG